MEGQGQEGGWAAGTRWPAAPLPSLRAVKGRTGAGSVLCIPPLGISKLPPLVANPGYRAFFNHLSPERRVWGWRLPALSEKGAVPRSQVPGKGGPGRSRERKGQEHGVGVCREPGPWRAGLRVDPGPGLRWKHETPGVRKEQDRAG